MLKDCIEVFEKMCEGEEENACIIDNYVLAEGDYLLVDKEGNQISSLSIAKKDKNRDFTDDEYKYFSKLDYWSKLIDMNKPIDSKKVIHSNNYLSFFIKKENLTSGKLTEEIIDKYYAILKNPLLKYTSKKSTEIYKAAEDTCGKIEEEILERNKAWIKENIGTILEKYDLKADKSYLKIFFEAEDTEWAKEYNKYILPNIYNATDYNVTIENTIYGMPNDNIGLNSKKPYLKHKDRKNEIPYLISTKEVLLQNKFFAYLMTQVSQGKNHVYISENKIKCIQTKESINDYIDEFKGQYLYIQKGKEVEIKDFDTVQKMTGKLKDFYIPQSMPIDYSKLKYSPTLQVDYVVSELKELRRFVDSIFFKGKLREYYFAKDVKDIKINDSIIKYWLIQSKGAFHTWFYKENDGLIKPIFAKMSRELIKNTIANYSIIAAKEQWMLREAILHYFHKGEKRMSDILIPILGKLEKRILGEEEAILENDKEYAVAVGQLSYYFLSRSKETVPKHSLIMPILNAKQDKIIKKQLRMLFKKYNYDIHMNAKKFNCLYSMVEAYIPENKIDQDALLYGYLSNNLLYKGAEGKKETKITEGDKVNE